VDLRVRDQLAPVGVHAGGPGLACGRARPLEVASATAVTVAPFTAVASVRTCELPIAPAPITPTLISSNPLARSAESTHTPGYDHLAVDEQADGVRVVVWAHVEHDEPPRRASGHGRPIEAIAGFSVVVERRTQLLRAGRHRSDDHVRSAAVKLHETDRAARRTGDARKPGCKAAGDGTRLGGDRDVVAELPRLRA